MRNLSSMIGEIRGQTEEVRGFTLRMRDANRAMTGGTGEAPTPINTLKGQLEAPEPHRPLLDSLSYALEQLNNWTAELRSEVNYLESWAETGAVGEMTTALTAAGVVNQKYASLNQPARG